MNDQRSEAIKIYASKKKVFTVEQLAKELNVSVTTIRRNVAELAKEGILLKRYGRILWNGDESGREQNNIIGSDDVNIEREADDQMARIAAEMIDDGDCIFIESGACCVAMSKYINKKNVTVVTSDLQQALSLIKNERLNIIVLGGYVWRGSYLLYGDITEKSLEGMHFKYYFSMPGSISVNGDIMYFDAHTSGTRILLRSISEKIVLFAPKRRVGRTAFLKLGTLNDCDTLITDCTPSELPTITNPSVKILSINAK